MHPTQQGSELKQKTQELQTDTWVCSCTQVIPALGRWRQKSQEFKVILGSTGEFDTSPGYDKAVSNGMRANYGNIIRS